MFWRLRRKIIAFQTVVKSGCTIPWQCTKRLSQKLAIKFNRRKHASASSSEVGEK